MIAQTSATRRTLRLIADAVQRLALDLRGFTVLTEAGSGSYAATPAIAVAAGADRVIAVTRDSPYGRAADNIAAARILANGVGSSRGIEFVVGAANKQHFGAADVITNLGFVRPIDSAAVAAMKPTAAVPLMCEFWEWRIGDVDLAACRAHGIPVLGTNENAANVDVFNFSGALAAKLLFEAGLEVRKCQIVVFGPDQFGTAICDFLRGLDSKVTLVTELHSVESRHAMASADALLVAAYARRTPVIGPDGDLTAHALAALAPSLTVIQFAGAIDAEGLRNAGIEVFPEAPVGPVRMARTLAHVGPRPVIDLHAAGLKVGELACRARRSGMSLENTEAWLAATYPLVQVVRDL